jgi:uncharacterized membrane protein YGL010W
MIISHFMAIPIIILLKLVFLESFDLSFIKFYHLKTKNRFGDN